jgi:selenocysteine-specific elongation factor
MTVVVGTAGHIDHGKTTLLQALTGIDADRLPEERRRGMTIDVGYAYLALDDGTVLDFVDVPGHDKLVGNMLVGAGEIEAAMLVVAADDGPRAQTLEHLALLDALGIDVGLVVITKTDAVEPGRVDEVVVAVRARLAGTSLASVPILAASSRSGEGLDEVRSALAAVADTIRTRLIARPGRPPSLAIDRAFTIKGRGVVVTGSLNGASLTRGDTLRLVPGDTEVRVREIQVHGATTTTTGAGRTALNLSGIDGDALHRGQVLTADPAVVSTSRILVALARPLADRARGRVHLGTAALDGAIGRSGADAVDLPDGRAIAIIRLSGTVAAGPGDRFVLRRSGPDPIVGGIILDATPPRGISRRRQTVARMVALSDAVATMAFDGIAAARLDLHGALVHDGRVALAADVERAARDVAATTLAGAEEPITLPALRSVLSKALRRSVSLGRDAATEAATAVVDTMARDGGLVRVGDRVARPGWTTSTPDPRLTAAMDRLVQALTIVAPPPLSEAARACGCPAAGVRELERSARIVVLAPDLAYAMPTYRDLTATALALAGRAPLTPAAYRDATGTSRKYVMAILEDLDRRGILRRTPDGHVLGPKAPMPSRTVPT